MLSAERQMIAAHAEAAIDPSRVWSDLDRIWNNNLTGFYTSVSRVIHATHSHFNGTRWVRIGEF